MSTATKLTKKQLKAEKFRKKEASSLLGGEKKKGKGRSPRSIAKEKKMLKAMEAERLAREAEKEGLASNQPFAEKPMIMKATPETSSATKEEKTERKEKKETKEKKEKKSKRESLGSGSEKKQEGSGDGVEKTKPKTKRKHEEGEEKVKRTKKLFTEDGQVEEVEVEAIPAAKEEEEDSKDDRRFIVFVGNMSFQATSDDIAKHFASHCGETPSVRLLTSKGDPQKLAQLSKAKQKSIARGKASDPSAPTSKGCAFVEFQTANALQKALQYHHTQFQGRSINVELTAGGGGKGNERKEKIKKKNQDLESERQKLHEKYVKGQRKDKKEGEDKVEEPKKEQQLPAWGPRASTASKQKGTTKIPRWAASGSNAVRPST